MLWSLGPRGTAPKVLFRNVCECVWRLIDQTTALHTWVHRAHKEPCSFLWRFLPEEVPSVATAGRAGRRTTTPLSLPPGGTSLTSRNLSGQQRHSSAMYFFAGWWSTTRAFHEPAKKRSARRCRCCLRRCCWWVTLHLEMASVVGGAPPRSPGRCQQSDPQPFCLHPTFYQGGKMPTIRKEHILSHYVSNERLRKLALHSVP